MSVRRKTLLIILTTLACLTIAIFAISQIIIANSYYNLEAQKIRENVRPAQSAIFDDVARLDSVCQNIARRDDTYSFIQNIDKQYTNSTLDNRFFSDFGINFALFLDKSGNLVYGKGFDVGSQREISLEPSLREAQLNSILPILYSNDDNIHSGIVLLPESPAIIASYPILTSLGSGPNQGTLIIGYYLDSTRMKGIADSTYLYHLNIYQYADNNLPQDLTDALTQLNVGVPIAVSPLSDYYVAGYTLLNGMNSNPVLVLKEDEPRTIHAQGIVISHYFTYAVIIVGIIFTIIIILLLEKWVLSRLTHLRRSVSNIELSHGQNARIALPGNDEFTDLSTAIDQMLLQLEGSFNDLRQSEEKYRSVLESIEEGYFEMDGQGKFTVVNDALCQSLGYSEEQLLGEKCQDYVEEAYNGQLNEMFAQISHNHEPVKWLPWHARRSDKAKCYVGISIYPVLDSSSRILGFRGVARDVTELVKTEEALRESEEKFSKAFHASPACMAITTLEDGRYIEINESFTNMMGYSRENIIGRRVLDIHRWDESNARDRIIEELRTHGRVLKEECKFRTKSGAIKTMLYSAETLKIGGSVCALSVTIDITDRKQTEQQLLVTSKLASIGELASGVAHELNNPLTSIIGYAQLLASNQAVEADVKADLDKIYRESQRAAKIVQNILSFARQNKPKKSAHLINDLVKQTLELRAYEHKTSNITVKLNLGVDLPPIMADYYQIQQVLLNMVINAEHAIAEAKRAGEITISTEGGSPFIRIIITDNGCGIGQENLDRIFDPFFTTKDVNKGTGLGLSICHGILSEHGGRIYVDTTSSQGTSFCIELPVADESGVKPAVEVKSLITSPNDAKTKKNILIIDDEPGIREVMKRFLVSKGYSTSEAPDGKTGLAEIERNGYDLCILDMKMPDMSGQEIFENIKRKYPEYINKVIFVTGDTITPSTQQYLKATGRPYLGKPFSYQDLMEKIERCLSSKQERF